MNGKLALVVDDSRTAAEMLARVLEQHGLEVRTTDSAEDALDYLQDQRPDVIFMDHMMPGMDGFEALRLIKDNPATATIPIMMYTSQSGELYVGQARALGAVGVLPKQIRPVEITRMLESLHLVGDEIQQPSVQRDTAVTKEPGPAVHASPDTADLLRELGRTQRRLIREESDLSTTRIIDSLRDMLATGGRRDDGAGVWPLILLAAVALGASWFAWQSHRAAVSVAEDYARFEFRQPASQEAVIDATGTSQPAVGPTEDLSVPALAAIEWALNQSASIPYGEIPLGDSRMAMMEQLVVQLTRAGFSGTIRLESHVGRFCEVRNAVGDWALADPDDSLAQCGGLADDVAAAVDTSARQSVAFANSLAVLGDPSRNVRVEVSARGASRPLIPYPYPSPEIRAGDWNEVASINNRVEVRLVSDY